MKARQVQDRQREKLAKYGVAKLSDYELLMAIITIGTLTASLVHPRVVFADAITDRAMCDLWY